MTSYEKLWDFAEDHYGIVMTAQAVSLGVDMKKIGFGEIKGDEFQMNI
jgi:hypothetical protein